MTSSTSTKIPFTAEAYLQLQADLDRLTQTEKEVIIRLKIAREMGDLSENAAYHAAKFELGSVRRQLSRVKYLLTHGQVVTKSKTAEIGFGSQVTVVHQTQQLTFTLVSHHESNPQEGKLSIESPIGQAVLGKKKHDHITVTTPKGTIDYVIVEVN